MADKTPDDDMKAKFREALERKQGKTTEADALVDSTGKSVHGVENVAKQRTFRRRAGG